MTRSNRLEDERTARRVTGRAALRAVFGRPAAWEQPALNPYQEASLQAFMQRFGERANDSGMPAFDDSTVARWSRDLIPEMEKLVLDRIKPAQQTVHTNSDYISLAQSRTGSWRLEGAAANTSLLTDKDNTITPVLNDISSLQIVETGC